MSMIPEQYSNAVVAIGVRNGKKEPAWVATGFMLTKRSKDNGNYLFLVTNRHVLGGEEEIVIKIKEKEKQRFGKATIRLVDRNSKPKYRLHPNKDVDIAVLPLAHDLFEKHNLEFSAFDIENDAMTTDVLTANGVGAGSLVYMLGFPLGDVNKHSNAPICRLGCIGRMCEAQIEETHSILLDTQGFPGNSGGPVITRPEFISLEGTKTLKTCVLMGIVHSYIPYQEKLMSTQTRRVVEVREENSGITNIHPVEYIRELIDDIIQTSPESKTDK